MSALSNPNSNGNSLFFTGNSSRAKKLEEPAWSLLYDKSEMPAIVDFVKKNLNDLPKYKHHTQERITRASYIDIDTSMEMNYDVIISRYTKLRAFYSVKAANKIIEYVNANYQHGSKNIIRPTLNLIISLFEPNIIEEFERDFTIDKLRKILVIYLFSPKYRNTAYHICKDPSINLETNSRIKYKPSWVQSGVNALSSKKFLFDNFFPIFSGKPAGVSSDDMMKGFFDLNIPILSSLTSRSWGPLSGKGKQTFKSLGGIYKKEIEVYEKNYEKHLLKGWSHCLPNEIEKGSKCIPVPYLRLDITDKEKDDMLADLFKIIKRISSLPDDDDEKSETAVKIINSYPLHKYIAGEYEIQPATYAELVRYAGEQNITVHENTTADEISFVLLFTMCKGAIIEAITDVFNAFIIHLPVEYKTFISHIRFAFSELSRYDPEMNTDMKNLDVFTYISFIRDIKKSLPDEIKEEFENIIDILVKLCKIDKEAYSESRNKFESYAKQDGSLFATDLYDRVGKLIGT